MTELPFETYERILYQPWAGGTSPRVVNLLRVYGIQDEPGSAEANTALQEALIRDSARKSNPVRTMFRPPPQVQMICDCPTKDALVCKQHPDCRPSYCKMRLFDQPPILIRELQAKPAGEPK